MPLLEDLERILQLPPVPNYGPYEPRRIGPLTPFLEDLERMLQSPDGRIET